MPNHTGERRLWPPDSDNEADLIELLGVKPEQLVAMAPPGQVKVKRYKLGARTEPFIHVGLVAFLAGARALDGRARAGRLGLYPARRTHTPNERTARNLRTYQCQPSHLDHQKHQGSCASEARRGWSDRR